MSKHRKSWKVREKIEILNYSEEKGVAQASREYEVSPGTIYKWKEKFALYGELGLSRKKPGLLLNETEFKRLKRENEQLKLLLAEKELENRIQREMLKKSH